MKCFSCWIAIFLLVFAPGPLLAQDGVNIVKGAVTLDGLQVGKSCTIRKILETFGERPTMIFYPSVWDEILEAYTFFYGIDRIYLAEGDFYGFDVVLPRYLMNNYIRVGDPIEKVDALGGTWERYDTDRIHWRTGNVEMDDWLSVDFFHDDLGCITRIDCFIDPF